MTSLLPPSLPAAVKARIFLTDDEIMGVTQADVPSLLSVAEQDGWEIHGWDLVVIDHDWSLDGAPTPVPVKGHTCSGIPMPGRDGLTILSGFGTGADVVAEIAALDLKTLVEPEWLAFVRFHIIMNPAEAE